MALNFDSESNLNNTDLSTKSAVLSKRPKTLFDLWNEYEIGLTDHKPAKDYTSAERGANKFAYSRKKVFWDLIVKLVHARESK